MPDTSISFPTSSKGRSYSESHGRHRPVPEKKPLVGALAGLVAAITGAIVWAILTVTTECQIGWMALGVGALVGFALRIGNGGKLFGIMGAFLRSSVVF